MRSPVGESARSRNQRVDGLLREKDQITGGLGELLDASCHVDRVTDQSELELAAAADGPRDYHAGVDSNADPKLRTEPLGNHALNQDRSVHCGVGVIDEVVGCAEHGECAIAEELVDMPT